MIEDLEDLKNQNIYLVLREGIVASGKKAGEKSIQWSSTYRTIKKAMKAVSSNPKNRIFEFELKGEIKSLNKRFKTEPYNIGTDEIPMYTDWENIIDTYNNNAVVYTSHSLMCEKLLEEINNPNEHNVGCIHEYIQKVKRMENAK